MSKKRILILSTPSSTPATLETRLRALDYEVAAVVDPEDRERVKTAWSRADLILMDVPPQSPELRNAVLVELEQARSVPVVRMIAESNESALDRADPSRPHGHVVKPFTDRELHATIELALCRHDAAHVVRETEERFFADSIDMLCFLDFDGHFARLNPAWERTLGFTLDELKSRPFIEFVHPDDRERTLAKNAQVRSGGHALSFENRYLCKDGSYKWLHWNAASDSTARVIYSVARDVTERKRTEAERDRLVQELRAALDEVSRLQGILPICSYCRKIRDDENYWDTVEAYIGRHTSTRFTHSICPTCMANEVEPHFDAMDPE